MKTVYLLRHAKSSWTTGARRDFDRPLNERGRQAAPAMGAFLARNDLRPDIVYCSSTARTRETYHRLAPSFAAPPPVVYRDGLYLASAERLLEEIHAADDGDASLMLIGHNPGMEDLAAALVDPKRSETRAVARLVTKFPTAALAQFQFNVDAWIDVEPRAGALKRFQLPRELDA